MIGDTYKERNAPLELALEVVRSAVIRVSPGAAKAYEVFQERWRDKDFDLENSPEANAVHAVETDARHNLITALSEGAIDAQALVISTRGVRQWLEEWREDLGDYVATDPTAIYSTLGREWWHRNSDAEKLDAEDFSNEGDAPIRRAKRRLPITSSENEGGDVHFTCWGYNRVLRVETKGGRKEIIQVATFVSVPRDKLEALFGPIQLGSSYRPPRRLGRPPNPVWKDLSAEAIRVLLRGAKFRTRTEMKKWALHWLSLRTEDGETAVKESAVADWVSRLWPTSKVGEKPDSH
ncbi:MAG: hypothetical protein JNN22_14880 [Rhodospirillales bacterium]|nr:hypothetical protein [Rhodospirillales bacterium]